MAAFGWSAGDVAMAIRIVLQIAEAFDNAKGAQRKYAACRSFLRGLAPVLRRIKQCVESPEDVEYRADIMAQGVIIHEAYTSFEEFLNDRMGLSMPGLSIETKLRRIKDTVLLSLDEMKGKVEKLQSKVVNAMAFIGPILAFEIKTKIEEVSQSLGQSSEKNEAYQVQVGQLLSSIQDQTRSLQLISSGYNAQLKKGPEESHDSTKEEMGAIQKNMEKIEDSQKQLVESLRLLTQQIEKQCQRSTSVTEAEEWANLREDAEEQSDSLTDLKETTSRTLDITSKTIDGLNDLGGGNGALVAAGQKVTGMSKLFGIANGLFASKKKSTSASEILVPVTTRSPSTGSQIVRSRERPSDPNSECIATDVTCTSKPRTQNDIVPVSHFPVPPSRTGQRPLDTSIKGPRRLPNGSLEYLSSARPPLPQRSLTGVSVEILADDEERPPLPARSPRRPNVAPKPTSASKPAGWLGPSRASPVASGMYPASTQYIPQYQPEAHPEPPDTPRGGAIKPSKVETRPSPRPKPASLASFTPPSSPRAPSAGSRTGNQQSGYVSPVFDLGQPPQTPPQTPYSELCYIPSKLTRSPPGKLSPSTAAYSAPVDLETAPRFTWASDSAVPTAASVPARKVLAGSLCGGSELLSFAGKRDNIERTLGRDSV